VVLEATHVDALKFVTIDALLIQALDRPAASTKH
jgi:hypothetical protein